MKIQIQIKTLKILKLNTESTLTVHFTYQNLRDGVKSFTKKLSDQRWIFCGKKCHKWYLNTKSQISVQLCV